LKLHSPVSQVKGVGEKIRQILHKNGIDTVFDLLLNFPVQYIDFSQASTTPELGPKKLYKIEVLVWSGTRRFGRRPSLLKVKARVGKLPVYIVFFNKPYLAEFFKIHKEALLYGQLVVKDKRWEVNTPLIYPLHDTAREPVMPLYSSITSLKSGSLKKIIKAALDNLEDGFDSLPTFCKDKYGFPGTLEALRGIHFPGRLDTGELDRLKRRFKYKEFLFFQLELQYIRNFFKRVRRCNHYTFTEELKTKVKEALEFDLTPDQKKVCQEIMTDLAGEYTMQRLLQGDVGSGKTIVAFIALLMARVNNYQGAFLAPTEILATQHFSNAQRFFKSARIQLLTGSTTAKKRKEILRDLKEGSIDIIFGTHALLTDAVEFQRLAMVVIDEQHRFGVSQRAALYYKGKAVDLLVTTATPIPRTMLLSLYNDLAVSTIKTRPQGRRPIITKIIPPERRDDFYNRLKQKVHQGEKVYIILPLIEKSEFFSELRDIETELSYFKKVFAGINLGVVTGRTKAVDKDAALQGLADGTIRVLIATTVIEVGIDVKDATFIVIEDADRYGLSQLHQLRGRVGRGKLQSRCYLFTTPNITESGAKRLKTIVATTDGFKIAETDLKMRGGGILSGQEQSGYWDFKIGNLQDDLDIFKEAQGDAALLLANEERQNKYIVSLLSEVALKLKDINFS